MLLLREFLLTYFIEDAREIEVLGGYITPHLHPLADGLQEVDLSWLTILEQRGEIASL